MLVGISTGDDAGVFRLSDDLAIVNTVDFFTPIVDDPFDYGRIAALNSINDVWAMGGTPVTAMAITCFPKKGVDFSILQEIMRGGLSVLTENKVVLVGGHSVDNEQIMFGYAVTGSVHPDRFTANSGARAGDALVFTKRLGTGVITTALKREIASEAHLQTAIDSMLLLNRRACETMLEFEVHGCTDVTGFGLIGHAREMAIASAVTLEIDTATVQFLPGALDYARQGALPGGLKNNREFASGAVVVAREIPAEEAESHRDHSGHF